MHTMLLMLSGCSLVHVQVQVNDKFAKLSESLFMAERVARKEIEARQQLQKAVSRKQKEDKENKLRAIAQQVRSCRSCPALPCHDLPCPALR